MGIVRSGSEIIPMGSPCAIIGNSGRVLENNYGEIIEGACEVIRFNCAETDGFEKQIGHTTTTRIINRNLIEAPIDDSVNNRMSKYFGRFDRNFVYKLKGEKIGIKSQPNIINKCENVIKLLEKENSVFIIDWGYVENLSKKCRLEPSCGILGLQIASEQCKHIMCFGFNFYKENWDSQHYFEKVRPHGETGHDFKKEELYFNDLVEKHGIAAY